jgi:hypothetical protein
MWDEEFDVTQSPEVADTCTAQVPDKGDIRNKDAYHNNEYEGCGPGRYFVWAETVVC